MKRKELLLASLAKEGNVDSIVESTTNKDKKFLKRAKRDLEDKIEELKDQLEERLGSSMPLDKSVIEVTFHSIKDNEATLELYKSFEKEYIGE